MNYSQWLSAMIVEQVLIGNNLDKSFKLILTKYDDDKIENLPQIKDMVYGAIRNLGKSYFYIDKLVKNKIENKCLESLLHIALFQIINGRSNDFTLVNQAVYAAKRIDYKKSSFINGVLRNFLRSKDNLQKELKEFRNFTFWSEHLILHTYKSLQLILSKSGFKNINIQYYQRYNFSNHLGWFLKRKPGGHDFYKNIISEKLNQSYIENLISLKKTDTLIAVAEI